MEIDDKMPYNEYFEYFGPEYNLHIAPTSMANKNQKSYLDSIRFTLIQRLGSVLSLFYLISFILSSTREVLLENLSKLQHVPSVQFQERPPDTELLDEVSLFSFFIFGM